MPRTSPPSPLRPTDADRALAAQAMEEIGKVAAVMADIPNGAQAHLKIDLARNLSVTRAFGTDGREIGLVPVQPKKGWTPTAHEAMRIAGANADLVASGARLKALLEVPGDLRNKPSMHIALSLGSNRQEVRSAPSGAPDFRTEVWYADQQILAKTHADKLARLAMVLRLLTTAEPPVPTDDPPPSTWSITMRADANGKATGLTRSVVAPDLRAAVRVAVRQFALALAVQNATPSKSIRVTVTRAERVIDAATLADAVAAIRAFDADDPDLAGILDPA